MREKILIVDDEERMRRVLQMMLEREGYEVKLAEHGAEALSLLAQEPFDLLITDMRMPEMNGLELLKNIKKIDERIPVIIITAYGTIQNAVEAMKHGAYDYILKPFDMEEMKTIISRALELERLRREREFLREEVWQQYRFEDLIGRSPAMRNIFSQITRIAKTKSTVLITGESGTGKELVARAIHINSPRANAPFVAINCAALPENLLESELFGHVKGAFTGAVESHPGKFERADGGTLFLDEVSSMSPALQAKLLRVLETQEFERVGGTNTIKVDVRIIAATNKNLEELIREGKFREDLYFRLNVVPIKIPPLRERREDIPLLVRHFVEKFCKEMGKKIKSISKAAMEALVEYDWPGNVRELQNIIERAVVLSEGDTITVNDLPFRPEIPTVQIGDLPYKEAKERLISRFERDYFEKLLKETGGNISQAARRAGMDRKNFYDKIKRLGLKVEEFRV